MKVWRSTVPIVVLLLQCACVGPRVSHLPNTPMTLDRLGVQGASETLDVADDWWKAFGDPALDELVDKALSDHPTLTLAAARVARAAAFADFAESAGLPQLDARADALHQRYSARGLYPPSVAGQVKDTGNLQATFVWQLDFFGRNQAAYEAALGNERAAQADQASARILLANSVVRVYVQLAQLLAQQEVTQRALAQRVEISNLTRRRVRAGLDTLAELQLSEGAVPDGRVVLRGLEEQIALRRIALAALTVQPVTGLESLAPRLAALRSMPMPESLPADLLERRPDVDAARRRVEAVSAELHLARAAFYPNINLLAAAGVNAIGLGRVLDSESRQTGIGLGLTLPLFDAGRLQASYDGKAAEYDAAVASYNVAVIEAVRDARDQILSLHSIGQQREEQRRSQASIEAAYTLAQRRYESGLGSYLLVLNAENAVLTQRRSAIELTARAASTQAELMRSLGGGYTSAPAARAADTNAQ